MTNARILLCLVFSVLFHSGYLVNDDDDTIIDVVPKFPRSEDRKYYFGTVYKGTYMQGVQFCNYHGMALLSIETQEEDDIVFKSLTKYLEGGKYIFWTSGTRIPEEHWVWLSTGKPITYSPNTFTHPSDRTKLCLEIQYVKSYGNLFWNDVDCSLSRHTICETILPTDIGRLEKSCARCNLTLIN